MSPTSSTTTTSQRPLTCSSRSPPATAVPSNLRDAENDDYTIGRARSLHQCFRSERIQRAVDKFITLLTKACCTVSRRLTVMLEQGDLFSMSLDHCCQTSEKIHVVTQKVSKWGFFGKDKQSKFSLIIEQRLKKHEFQAYYGRRSIQKLNGIIESQRGEIHGLPLQDTNNFGEIHWNFVKLLWIVSMRRKNRSDFKDLHLMDFRDEDWSETLSLNSWVRFRTYRMKLNCINDSRDFQDVWISTQWTSPRYQSTCVFPASSRSWRNAEPFSRNAEPQQWAAKHLGHTWKIGKRFCKSSRVFFSTFSARAEPMEF